VGLPFLAPALMASGPLGAGAAKAVYSLYRPMCHQFGFRSWFLFGEKPYYEAPEFQARTGIEPYTNEGRWQAKNFLGNPAMGYKVAFCERDVAIYGGILLGGLIFARVRGRIRPLPVWAWLIFGVLPMAIDGGTQLVSGFPIAPAGWAVRESTPLLRTATGLLFGLLNVWLAYPYLEESMAETRAAASVKLAGADPPPAEP
jgi:uncharacterized membrane protein